MDPETVMEIDVPSSNPTSWVALNSTYDSFSRLVSAVLFFVFFCLYSTMISSGIVIGRVFCYEPERIPNGRRLFCCCHLGTRKKGGGIDDRRQKKNIKNIIENKLSFSCFRLRFPHRWVTTPTGVVRPEMLQRRRLGS